MKKLLSGLFGRRPNAPQTPPPSVPYNRDSPVTIEDGSENATRRQLIQVLLRDVLRKSGIPAEWIECQMLLVASRSRGQGMYVRLVVRHWDERFMNYLFAFQQTLMADIRRFEPNAGEWLHGISWQLELQDQCPYASLPEKSFWQDPVKPEAPPVVTPDVQPMPEVLADPDKPAFRTTTDDEETNRARDLASLFAIRDQALERDAASGITPVGYEKTQPSPL